jgi:hypothetical protein
MALSFPSLLRLTSALAFVAAACSSNDDRASRNTTDAAPASGETGTGDGPFAPQPDESEGLVNVSADLDALLEKGALKDACAKYFGGAKDRRSMLLCGKAMFFYEGFGTAGVPKPLVTFLVENFPDEVGRGFEKVGMVPDPSSKEGLPLGLAPGGKLGSVDTLAFACASCHFAKMPDGRYAVGAPNHGWEYGVTNLMLAVMPALQVPGAKKEDHDALALARIKPLLDKLDADASLKVKLMGALLPLISGGGSAPPFPKEAEHHYAKWKPGTMDFFIEPLPFNDKIHTVSKISALWGIPTPEEAQAAGMESGMLGFTGGTASLSNFTYSFVELGGGKPEEWPDDKRAPLVAYIHSLRAPQNPNMPEAAQVAKGEALFRDKGCLDCHAGPRGSGKRVYTYEEIGTDDAMKRWADPDLTGKPAPGFRFPAGDRITNGIKSPRLVGMWAMTKFLHNGSLDDLDALFCMKGARPTTTEPAYGDGGHAFTCDGLGDDEKAALKAYLLAQ